MPRSEINRRRYASSSVAVLYDDVYMNSPAGQLAQMFDTEKVDVVANLVGTLGPVAVGILAGVVAPGGVELGSAQLGLVENTVHTLQSAVIAGRVGAPSSCSMASGSAGRTTRPSTGTRGATPSRTLRAKWGGWISPIWNR